VEWKGRVFSISCLVQFLGAEGREMEGRKSLVIQSLLSNIGGFGGGGEVI